MREGALDTSRWGWCFGVWLVGLGFIFYIGYRLGMEGPTYLFVDITILSFPFYYVWGFI